MLGVLFGPNADDASCNVRVMRGCFGLDGELPAAAGRRSKGADTNRTWQGRRPGGARAVEGRAWQSGRPPAKAEAVARKAGRGMKHGQWAGRGRTAGNRWRWIQADAAGKGDRQPGIRRTGDRASDAAKTCRRRKGQEEKKGRGKSLGPKSGYRTALRERRVRRRPPDRRTTSVRRRNRRDHRRRHRSGAFPGPR